MDHLINALSGSPDAVSGSPDAVSGSPDALSGSPDVRWLPDTDVRGGAFSISHELGVLKS